MEARLTELEIRYSFLERAVSDLDKIALDLRGEIERLQRELSTIREVVLEATGVAPPNEKPPHY